ncbi:MAG: elongation factor G [Sphingomonadales bacterium]|jgi:elongation factor G|nr:elongation factor G [Sphingomonadales bacterium]MBK6491421.1 elongation factor G [Sphingomonadales bacterium]MBK6721624.1 elongation factor G [Sphingomonadales bacterium]MBK8859964.1 elongation factor G [Sphingomonadales bacterium]MBK9588860.1 elongation factor G [Sphingomonadales bacterium]
MAGTVNGVRAVALVGPAGAGKTSLAEALLYASGTISRQGSVEAGTSLGDASPEARARRGSTELNLFRLDYLGDKFALIDAPGAVSFAADGLSALEQADMAIVVVDPDPARAGLVEPTLKRIEALGLPHAIFFNKIDSAKGRIRDLLEALQPLSAAPLIARQIPIREGDAITGFVDLALERAFHYQSGKPSEQIAIPDALAERESSERFHMLEQLADHDDALLEQLLSDETPDIQTVFKDLVSETRAGLVVPVMFGSALNGFGVRRLLKMLRHEAPGAPETAMRLGTNGSSVQIFKIANGGSVGRLALARILGDGLAEGAELVSGDGEAVRVGALFSVQGDKTIKLSKAEPGDIVAIAKADNAKPGMLLGRQAHGDASIRLIDLPPRNASLAIATRDRKDDVRLSTALHKLVEEDPALDWGHDDVSHETVLRGINDEHLAVTLAKLKRRYGVEVDVHPPRIAYKESIRKGITQRGRHKKQSGGHGQFGDVVIEVRPLPRGEGFRFDDRITGGAIPKQWIPAVEMGVRDAMEKGPLGYPVVDVAVTLIDGSFHSVDSSELAFRIAGRIAMSEALPQCQPYLLEPMCHLVIETPTGATSKASSTISSRRGQILGIGSHPSWQRWDRVEAIIPEAGLHGLDAELRSMSQGLASFTARYDHVAELSGKLADDVIKQAALAA